MAYKNPKKQREYMKRWRSKHPTYMRKYYQERVKPILRSHAPKRQPDVEEVEV